MPFGYRSIGINRKSPHRKEGENLAFLGFLRRRRIQESAIRSGLSGSAELGDSKTRKSDALREKSLHCNPARHGPNRRAMRGSCQRNSSKMARELPSRSRAAKCCCGDAAIKEPCFAVSLRFWHAWRERLARPDQRRLYRKSLQWSQSRLLSPGPSGAPLGRGGPPQERSAATQPGRRAQQHRADHSGKNQSRFPRVGSLLRERDPALAQIPRGFRAARFRV